MANCDKTILVLTLCILETQKRVLLQTVKTQIKCSIILHFIGVFTVCKCQKALQTNTFFSNYNLTPLEMYNGLSKFIVLSQKEESMNNLSINYIIVSLLCLLPLSYRTHGPFLKILVPTAYADSFLKPHLWLWSGARCLNPIELSS